MSISENLTRLQNAKDNIGNAITNNGGTVETTDGLEEYPTRIRTRFGEVNDTLSILLKGPTLITKTINENGTYDAEDDNADGYSAVTVNVPTGGYEVTVTTLANAIVTLSKTGTTCTATADSNGIATFIGVTSGTYTVTAVYDDATSDSTTITITDFSTTENTFATLTISASDNCTITVTNGTTTKTLSYTGTPIVQYVSLGTWTVSATIDSTLITRTVSVSSYTNESVYLSTTKSVTRQVNFANNTSPVTPSASDLAASSVYSGITRCNVADDGTILAYYGDSGYTEDGSNGQVMVKIPKFWYKLETESTSGNNIEVGQWYISDGQLDSSYKLHPAFINANGDGVDYFLIGAFENTFQNGSSYTETYNASYKMASVGSNGGTSIKPGNTFTRAEGRACASARGTGWYQIGFKQIQAVQMLFGVEFGFNSQNTVGQGYTYSANSASTYVGQTTNVTSGDTTTGGTGDKTPVCWRGIENLWGNIRSWIDGFIGNSGTGYFKNDYNFNDTYSSSTYTQIGFTLPSSNYSTYFGYDSTNDWIIFPHSTSSASNPTGSIGDYFYKSTSTNCMCCLGGYWDKGASAGLFYFSVSNDSSASSSNIGARLMYVPTT